MTKIITIHRPSQLDQSLLAAFKVTYFRHQPCNLEIRIPGFQLNNDYRIGLNTDYLRKDEQYGR